MALYTIANTRGTVFEFTNWITNPAFRTGVAGWTYQWFGNGGNGTNGRLTGMPWISSGCAIQKQWTVSPSSNQATGFGYTDPTWKAGMVRSVAAAMLDPTGGGRIARLQVLFYDAGGAAIGFPAIISQWPLAPNVWQLVSGQGITAPAGTASAFVMFDLADAGVPMQVGSQLILSGAVMVDGASLPTDGVVANGSSVAYYFDGSTPSGGWFTRNWTGTADASVSQQWKPDPATDVRPDLVLGYDTTTASRNVIHDLLSGSVAATLRPSSLRSGTLKLFFKDPAKAAIAELAHRRATSWQFADDRNPGEGMTYAVDGALHSYQDATRARRILEIPYREITP